MTARPSSYRLGYGAVAAAALLWAVGGTYARALLDAGAPAVELTEGRAWVAVVGVGLLVLARRPQRNSVEAGGRGTLALSIAFGLALASANFTYYAAIARLPVAVAIVIQYSAPALVVIYQSLAERQLPSRRIGSALVVAIAGVALVSEAYDQLAGGETALNSTGVLLAVASAFSFAAYIIFGDHLSRRLPADRSVFYGFVVASGFWLVIQLFRGRPQILLDSHFILPVMFLGVFTTVAPFLLFIWGMKVVTAAAAGIASTLEPVGAAIMAFYFLGQSLTPAQITGAGMVVVGIAILQQRAVELDAL